MIEALHALDIDLNHLFGFDDSHSFFDNLAFEASGLFCASLEQMRQLGEIYQLTGGGDAMKFLVNQDQCALLFNQYDVVPKWYGPVYTHGGESIQIIGVVPEGRPGPMTYIFSRIATPIHA